MTTTIQNLDDLQDRRIMMDRDVPPYGYAFVILVGLFMIFLLVWSTRTNRIYVSQNSGTVQASNKTYIMSSYSGTLTELYISEGRHILFFASPITATVIGDQKQRRCALPFLCL